MANLPWREMYEKNTRGLGDEKKIFMTFLRGSFFANANV